MITCPGCETIYLTDNPPQFCQCGTLLGNEPKK